MAEAAVVSALIDTFTSMVVDKLFQEVSLIANFRKDFEFFCEELNSIKCLLTDVGEKRNSSLVSNWLDSIEDFVADAEYLMEQCGSVDKFFAKLKFRLKMGHKIRELKARLKQIRGKAKDLKLLEAVLDVNAHGQARDADGFNERRERSYALPQEPQIVGMDDEIKVITKWILKEDSPPVIAVVGMGGQGKTLMLQHVFNSEEIRQRFHHHVWLAISQKYNDEELLRQVLRELEPNHNSVNLTKGELIEKIQENLEGKRCLFAVDDVWNRSAWQDIGLPSRMDDKVVLTTRDKSVAKAWGAGEILSKKSLSEENSWQLFCLHAFPDGAHHCPEALDKIAREIVKKCGGLPLAIKTIRAYLARLVREHPNDWQRTLDRLNEVDGMRDRVIPSLKLSYQALPPHLKPCFLYCSVFPKNTQIQSEYLVHAWIAQGFVSAKLEESYLDDLIDRCLIEVSEVGGDGRVQSCKMHHLLYDLAVSEQTKCLLKPGGQLERIPAEECQGLRRISLMKNEISTIQNGIRCPGLRSLLLSHNDRLTSISSSFFHNMRYLSVLDLSRTSIKSLPDSIGNLKLLKYLNLSRTSIKSLPDYIRNLKLLKYLNLSRTLIHELPESLSGLRHLQFLDVEGNYVKRLHSGIDKHKYMLHLNLGWMLKDCSVGISKLIYLQTLKGVRITVGNAASVNALQLRDLKELTLLQHLSITFYGESGDHPLEDEGTLRGMTKMRTLYVYNAGCSVGLHLPTDMETMEQLVIVHLNRCVVPKWIFQLQNLMELTLTDLDHRSSADFRGFEKIPNLKKLHMEWNRNPDFIEFPNEFGEAGVFLKLEELVIKQFGYLENIPSFQKDAMPKLRCLRMSGCKPLENMQEGLTNLKNLKEVEVEMRVDSLENFEYGKRHCWQSLKDRQIKMKVEVYDSINERLRVM